MTIDERSITTALQSCARGIDVTDADLDRLEERVNDRLHPASRAQVRGGRRWDWAVAACAVLALVIAMTALWRTRVEEPLPATPPPTTITPADLAGVWLVDVGDSDGYLWQFTADGKLDMTNSPEQYVDLLRVLGEYTLGADDVLAFHSDPVPCRATVRLAGEGRMTLTPIVGQENCDLFKNDVWWPFTRVSPASVAGTAMVKSPNLLAGHPDTPATPAVSTDDLVGTWLLQGTGTILVVITDPSSPDGRYTLDDDGDGAISPDQRGTATVRSDGGVVLRPSEGAPCDTVYSTAATTGTTLEAELADSSCGRIGGTRDTWIRLN